MRPASRTTTSTIPYRSDGIVRLTPVTDPGGSGRQVYLHRIVRADPNTSGPNKRQRPVREGVD